MDSFFRVHFIKQATWKYGILLGPKIVNLFFFWIGICFTEVLNVFYIKDVYVLHCTLIFSYEISKQILWRVR